MTEFISWYVDHFVSIKVGGVQTFMENSNNLFCPSLGPKYENFQLGFKAIHEDWGTVSIISVLVVHCTASNMDKDLHEVKCHIRAQCAPYPQPL